MKEIILTQGLIALVDDEDYPSLMLFKWYAKESWKKGSGKWYAVRKQKVCKVVVIGNFSYKRKKVDKRKTIRMHNVLMKPLEGFIAHHKDGDGLNNQRYNLENVTELKNQQEASVKRIENKKEKTTDDIPF